MKYKLTKSQDVPKLDKLGIHFDMYPEINGTGIVLAQTKTGHNQEFYHKESTFTYIILEGSGTFFLDDKAVEVNTGDTLSIDPNTRIYYKGALKMILITTPAWRAENEVETRSSIW